jgi:hypothetical protein
MSSTRKTPEHIIPAYNLLREGVDTGVDMAAEAAGAVQCTEAAGAVQCTEAAGAVQCTEAAEDAEAAGAAPAAAEAAVSGLQVSGFARDSTKLGHQPG